MRGADEARQTELLLAKGMLFVRSGETQFAITTFQEALRHSQKSATAHIIYAWGLEHAGNTQAADAEYGHAVRYGILQDREIVLSDGAQTMIRVIGDEGHFYFAVAKGFERAKQPGAAKAFFLRAAPDLAQRPDPLVIEAYDHALRLDPGDASTHAAIARFWAKWDDQHLDDVIQHWSEAVRLEPHNSEYHNELAKLYEKAGQAEKAKAEYAAAALWTPKDQHLSLELQLAAVLSGEMPVQPALTPDTPEALAQLRNCEDLSGVRGEVACHTALKIGLSPHNASMAHMYLAGELGGDAAVEEYREAIRIDPNYALPYFQLAEHLRATHNAPTDDQPLLYESAATLREVWVAPRATLAVVLRERNRHAEALEAGRKAAMLDPSDPVLSARIQRWRAEFAHDGEKLDAAAEQVRAIGSDASAHQAYAAALASTGRREEAVREYRMAYTLAPKNSWKMAAAILYGGFAYVACVILVAARPSVMGNVGDVLLEQDMLACTRLFPKRTSYWSKLARVQFSRGNGLATRRTYERIINLDSAYFQTHPDERALYDRAAVQRGAQ